MPNQEKYRVVNYNIKFITTRDRRYLENIILELKLENNRIFRMSGISYDVAMEIKKYLALESNLDIPTINDPRFTIYDMLLEIPDLEKILHGTIKEVVIDYYDPEFSIYGASVILDDAYTVMKKKLLMIPSHAILLALLANRNVYVSKKLVDGQDDSEIEFINPIFFESDEDEDEDEWDDEP